MNKQTLDAIRARLDAATPGTWDYEQGLVMIPEQCPWFVEIFGQVRFKAGRGEQAKHNAMFIAHAPKDIRALLDENARLLAALNEIAHLQIRAGDYNGYSYNGGYDAALGRCKKLARLALSAV